MASATSAQYALRFLLHAGNVVTTLQLSPAKSEFYLLLFAQALALDQELELKTRNKQMEPLFV